MRQPAAPSVEASEARRGAEHAKWRADRHYSIEASKLPEAEVVAARLEEHRRSNNFVEMFRDALTRRP